MCNSSTLPPMGRTVGTNCMVSSFSTAPFALASSPRSLQPVPVCPSALFSASYGVLSETYAILQRFISCIVIFLEVLTNFQLLFYQSAKGLQIKLWLHIELCKNLQAELHVHSPTTTRVEQHLKRRCRSPFNIASIVCDVGSLKNGIALRNLVVYVGERENRG